MHYRLFTPGPTSVPPQVLAVLAEPITHHRTPEFRVIFGRVQEGLRDVFRTKQEICLITGSGTAAFEAGLGSVLPPGARVLNIASGKFGERWGKMGRVYGCAVTDAPFKYGTHVTSESMAELLERDGGRFDAVVITHSETSTATACDLAAVAGVVRERAPEALVLVDGITSIGALPFEMDAWGIDVAVTGSQKALMLPPGLGFVALSERAWRSAERNERRPGLYLDLLRYREAAKDQDTPYTPAIPLVKALDVALGLLRAEGLENVWRRTRAHAEATRAGMTGMGLSLFSRMPADSVTAINYPPGVGDDFRRRLARQHNMHVAGGQESMSGKLFRVSHMGYTDLYDALACVAAVAHVLRGMGQPVDVAAGVSAAQRVLADYFASRG